MDAFRPFVREHKIFGGFFRAPDKNGIYAATEETYWDTFREERNFYLIQDKKDNTLSGYVFVENPETSAPYITIQISKRIEFKEEELIGNSKARKMIQEHYIHEKDYIKLYYWKDKKMIPGAPVILTMPINDIDSFFINKNSNQWASLVKESGIT